MYRINVTCIVFICLAFCLSLPAQDKAPEPGQPARTPAVPAPALASPESDLVVIKVLGEPISEKTVLAAIRQISGQKIVPTNPDQQRNVMLYQGAIDNLVISAALKNLAKQSTAPVDQTKVDAQMKAFESQYPNPEDFKKALAAQKVTEEELRKRVEENVKVQQFIDDAIKDTPAPTEDEIAKFYDGNPKSFARPERVRASHILLKTDKSATPEQKAEIRKKIEEIRADVESGKITFEDAAAKFSEDKGNAPKGGDLGFFPKGRMVKPFEEAAFAAQVGTLTPIVESDFGFHIIKAVEHMPADTVPLEEAKPRIQQFLEQATKRNATQQYVNGLKAKTTVETFMTAEEFLKRHPEVK
jgi:peptidyl-prolyl cis-trans isomerase C